MTDTWAAAVRASEDAWFAHFLRYVAVALAVSGSVYFFGAGIVWYVHIFNRTGYRRRDAWMLLIPVYGALVGVTVLWRYTARTVYWSARPDRHSEVLLGWQRPAAIAGGGLFIPILVAGAIATASVTSTGWTEKERTDYRDAFTSRGYDQFTANCLVGYLEQSFPSGPSNVQETSMALAVKEALDVCHR